MYIGQRDGYLLDLPGETYKKIERVAEEINRAVDDMELKETITHIYPGLIPPSSIVIGIAGNDEDKLRKVDERVISKIIEICEEMKVERHIITQIRIKKMADHVLKPFDFKEKQPKEWGGSYGNSIHFSKGRRWTRPKST